MADLISGAAVGAVFSEGLKKVITEIKTLTAFKDVFKNLESKMKELEPIVAKTVSLQGSNDDLKSLEATFKKANDLLKKCEGVQQKNIVKKSRYTKKMWKIWREMVSFCQVNMPLLQNRNQLQSAEDIKKLDIMMKDADINLDIITKKLDFFMETMNNYFQEIIGKLDSASEKGDYNHQIVVGKLNHVISTLDRPQCSVSDPCSVPKLDKVLFGMDQPLMKLKKQLLDHDVVRLVVTAPPGCGKTTLVTQLCHDKEIERKYEHIFYNVVSSAPNFKKIVQDILQHSGDQVLTSENDSQVNDVLRKLLKKLRVKGPILLVLDDVWRGSESFLEKFRINLPGYTILVTSRFDFPSFGSTYELKPLEDGEAEALLIQWARQPRHSSNSEYKDLLKEILRRCNGYPLVIEVVGRSLKGRSRIFWKGQVESWSIGETIFENLSVLKCLQPSFDALPLNCKECFLDMGLFLEDQKIRASSIIDIGVEFYGKGSSSVCMRYLEELASQNLLQLVPLGENEHEGDFYNAFLVTQHDILRELAISISESETDLERERLNLKITEDKFPDWCSNIRDPINARLVSISTDESFSSKWPSLDFPNVEVLVLHISSPDYALPSFIAGMTKLKVLTVMNHGFDLAKLSNFSCLSSLPNLKRIRVEKILITLLDILQLRLASLEKLSMFMCNFGEIFYDAEEIDVSLALPSLREIDFDYCYDLEELPYWVSEVVSLKTLSITNSKNLCSLPDAIGNLSKLETLRLSSCINLSKLPETIERLCNLRFLDISDCSELRKLPLEIGKLQKLKTISMRRCWRCELPHSVKNLEGLEVKLDEESARQWRTMKPMMRNLRIKN